MRNLLIIIGYRGCGMEVLENMMVVFKLVKENGVLGVEFDLDFIKDGVLVIIYDLIVDCIIDGYGKVCDFIYEEIRWFNVLVKYLFG